VKNFGDDGCSLAKSTAHTGFGAFQQPHPSLRRVDRSNGFGGRRWIGMLSVVPVLLMASMLAPGAAVAASFDCSRARTQMEKMVCADAVLSRLDEQLAEAYAAVLQKSGDSGRVKVEQRDWLKNHRDRCRDAQCLQSAYASRLAHLAGAGEAEWKTFRDTHLGIEFSYPGHRTVKIGCRESKTCVALVGDPMPGSEYLVAFEVFDGGLEQVAVQKAVFDKNEKGWIARGRSGVHPVEVLAGPGWQGIRAVVDCGVSDSQGFHAAAGECLWAVLSDGKRSVVVDTQGLAGNDEASMRSIQSLRFCR
jgi:uncharacterized protein